MATTKVPLGVRVAPELLERMRTTAERTRIHLTDQVELGVEALLDRLDAGEGIKSPEKRRRQGRAGSGGGT
jgi:hypothetical protein